MVEDSKVEKMLHLFIHDGATRDRKKNYITTEYTSVRLTTHT